MKNKTCMICKLGIRVDSEEHVEVKHYQTKDEIISVGYYHIYCFRERLRGPQSNSMLQAKAMQILNKIDTHI